MYYWENYCVSVIRVYYDRVQGYYQTMLKRWSLLLVNSCLLYDRVQGYYQTMLKRWSLLLVNSCLLYGRVQGYYQTMLKRSLCRVLLGPNVLEKLY